MSAYVDRPVQRTCFVWAFLLVYSALFVNAHAQVDRGEPGTAADELALGLDVEKTVGPPSQQPKQGAELDRITDDISARMRCPVCQGHAIVDSPSETARNLKRQVRAMVAAGYDEPQIFRYFEARYGEFIRLLPRAEGFNLLVWLLPLMGLVVGLVVVFRLVGRRRPVEARRVAEVQASRGNSIEAPSTPSNVSAEDSLEPWLDLVRREVKDNHD